MDPHLDDCYNPEECATRDLNITGDCTKSLGHESSVVSHQPPAAPQATDTNTSPERRMPSPPPHGGPTEPFSNDEPSPPKGLAIDNHTGDTGPNSLPRQMSTNKKGPPKSHAEDTRDSVLEAADGNISFEPLGADIDVITTHLEANMHEPRATKLDIAGPPKISSNPLPRMSNAQQPRRSEKRMNNDIVASQGMGIKNNSTSVNPYPIKKRRGNNQRLDISKLMKDSGISKSQYRGSKEINMLASEPKAVIGSCTSASREQGIKDRGQMGADAVGAGDPRIRELLVGGDIGCRAQPAVREVRGPSSGYGLAGSWSDNQTFYSGQGGALYMFESPSPGAQGSFRSGRVVVGADGVVSPDPGIDDRPGMQGFSMVNPVASEAFGCRGGFLGQAPPESCEICTKGPVAFGRVEEPCQSLVQDFGGFVHNPDMGIFEPCELGAVCADDKSFDFTTTYDDKSCPSVYRFCQSKEMGANENFPNDFGMNNSDIRINRPVANEWLYDQDMLGIPDAAMGNQPGGKEVLAANMTENLGGHNEVFESFNNESPSKQLYVDINNNLHFAAMGERAQNNIEPRNLGNMRDQPIKPKRLDIKKLVAGTGMAMRSQIAGSVSTISRGVGTKNESPKSRALLFPSGDKLEVRTKYPFHGSANANILRILLHPIRPVAPLPHPSDTSVVQSEIAGALKSTQDRQSLPNNLFLKLLQLRKLANGKRIRRMWKLMVSHRTPTTQLRIGKLHGSCITTFIHVRDVRRQRSPASVIHSGCPFLELE